MDINYREERDGRVIVTGEGVTLVDAQIRAEMTTAQTEAKSPFVKPVWKNTGTEVYRMDRAATSIGGRDNGKLRSLLMMRGNSPANADTPWDNIAINPSLSVSSDANAYLIPKIQKEFDIFVRELAKTINEVFNPTQPLDPTDPATPPVDIPWGQGIHKDVQGTELFIWSRLIWRQSFLYGLKRILMS